MLLAALGFWLGCLVELFCLFAAAAFDAAGVILFRGILLFPARRWRLVPVYIPDCDQSISGFYVKHTFPVHTCTSEYTIRATRHQFCWLKTYDTTTVAL